MIQALGALSPDQQKIVKNAFQNFKLNIEFAEVNNITAQTVITFDKEASNQLAKKGIKFYNWDLLFSVLGPNDTAGEVEKKLHTRIEVLQAVAGLKSRPVASELHGSIRVHNLAKSAGFYAWLFGVDPKEWTHRYVTFVRPDTKFNFVLLVSDGKELHHDTLYHLGMGVETKNEVISFYHSAKENNFHIEKPPRTTWRGTPLHELWLKDPDGTLIEVYARLTKSELLEMPNDKEPTFLT